MEKQPKKIVTIRICEKETAIAWTYSLSRGKMATITAKAYDGKLLIFKDVSLN